MTTVLLGWELGGGLGHVMRASALAGALSRQGVRVVVALANLADCASVTWPENALLLAAPYPRSQPAGFTNASTYAELIYGSGYHDVNQVAGLVTAWSNLIQLASADIVVADHAPSAQLAAKICGIPVVRIGSGFFAPPPGRLTPNYRTWETIDGARAEAAERHTLEVLNMTSEAAGLARFSNVCEALTPDLDLISSWPDLDCYAGLRSPDSVLYIGNEYISERSSALRWPTGGRGDRPRVVAYLKHAYPAILKVLEILGAGVETVAYVSGLNAEQRRGLSYGSLALTDEPIDLRLAAGQADALVCHAGAGTAPWFLANGKPVLLLPYSAEQMVNARQIELTGAGRTLLVGSISTEFATCIGDLVSEGRVRSAAERLAERWRTKEDAIELAARKVLGLVQVSS